MLCRLRGIDAYPPFPRGASHVHRTHFPLFRRFPVTAHAAVRFLAITALVLAAGPALAADPPVSGKFTGDGTEAKLAFVTASKGEPFADKATIRLVFTEKDHSKDAKAYIKAGFGDYGSALIITVHPDGKIIGCEVAHTAHN